MYLLSFMSETFEIFPWTQLVQKIFIKCNWMSFCQIWCLWVKMTPDSWLGKSLLPVIGFSMHLNIIDSMSDYDFWVDVIIFLSSGKRPFVCTVCGKGFSYRTALNKHMPVHSDDRHHKCPTCSKTFKTAIYLRKHLAVHAETQRRFVCGICGKMYSSKHNLLLHQAKICSKLVRLSSRVLADIWKQGVQIEVS